MPQAAAIEPPQSFSPEQQMVISSHPLTVLIEPPQGEFGDDTPETNEMIFNNTLELMLYNEDSTIMDYN